jgi:acylphosphatase
LTARERIVRLIIEGRVQGVWYRGWCVETAAALGLRGWVRNRKDGRVEAVVAGPPADVATMLARCRMGPPAARVQSVTVRDWLDDVAPGFRQLPTAR